MVVVVMVTGASGTKVEHNHLIASQHFGEKHNYIATGVARYYQDRRHITALKASCFLCA